MGIKKNIKLIFSKRIKGGALYVAVMVSIAIGIMLSLFVLASKNNQRNVTVFLQSSQLHYNLKSALEIAKSNYLTSNRNNRWFKNSINDDSIKIKKLNWGAYLIIVTETKNRHQRLSQSGLFGTYLSADTGLIVSDNSRPIGLSGKIVFKANCYLPRAGVKPAYIDGQSFVNNPGNSGFIKISHAQVPLVDEDFKKAIRDQKKSTNVDIDSLVEFLPQNITQSFTNKTIVCKINSTELRNVDYRNNIKIIGNNIIIDKSCHLENVSIICDKIRFKEGFKGSVHVIANDSIIVSHTCELVYPSSLVLSIEEGGGNSLKYVQLNGECKISGGIIAFNNSLNQSTGKTFIQLNAKSVVNGLVYSSDYIHIEGKINGTLIGNKLLIKTPSAVYENHILSCEINPKEFAHSLSVPMVFNKSAGYFCSKNLK